VSYLLLFPAATSLNLDSHGKPWRYLFFGLALAGEAER